MNNMLRNKSLKKEKEGKCDLSKERYNQFGKTNLIILVLICLISFMQFSFATTSQSDYLYPAEISDYRFLPSTIIAGDTVSVAIDVYNKGTLISMENVVLSLDINKGDYIEPIEGSTTSINSIARDSTKTAVLKFKIKDSAISGYYQLFLKMSFERTDYKGNKIDVNQISILTVPVSDSQKNVSIEFNPKIISPGNQTSLTVSVTNNASTPISNVSFSWTESNKVIVPLGSDNKRFASYIGPSETHEFNYLVVADPSIVTGVYPVDTTLNYVSSTGEENQTAEVGLVIGGKTDFQVSYEVSTAGIISFSIANIGSNDASAVIVQMPLQNGLSVSGSDTVILGNISTGDYSVASFNVTASSTDQNIQFAPGKNSNEFAPQNKDRNFSMNQNSSSFNQMPSKDLNSVNNFNQKPNENFYVDISYTDTTGERQHIKSSFSLSSKTNSLGLNSRGTAQFGTSSSGMNSNNSLILIGALAFLGLIGIIYNKVYRKKNWKNMLVITAIGIIVPMLIITFVPSQFVQTILALVFLLGALIAFFRK